MFLKGYDTANPSPPETNTVSHCFMCTPYIKCQDLNLNGSSLMKHHVSFTDRLVAVYYPKKKTILCFNVSELGRIKILIYIRVRSKADIMRHTFILNIFYIIGSRFSPTCGWNRGSISVYYYYYYYYYYYSKFLFELETTVMVYSGAGKQSMFYCDDPLMSYGTLLRSEQ